MKAKSSVRKSIKTGSKISGNTTFSLIGRFCGLLTTIAAVISDVLSPIAPFAMYFGLILSFLFFLSLCVFSISFFNRKIKSVFGSYWPMPIILTLFISSAMFFGTYALGMKSGNDDGYLSSKLPLVDQIQVDLGIIEEKLANIEEATQKTAESTKKIAKHTERTAENTEQIATETKKISTNTEELKLIVKRETSDDPRKELANLGINWSINNFVKSLMAGDLRAITLFLDGGMKPTSLYKGSSAILYAFQDNLGNNPVEILKLLKSRNYDLDTHMKDWILMHNMSNGTLPFAYTAEIQPEGYGSGNLYGQYFVGSILFWEVMINMYKSPNEKDFEVVRYLCSQKAETKYIFALLDLKNIHEMYFTSKYAVTAHLPIMDIIGYEY